MPAKRNDLDPDHIVRLYRSGLSAAAVGREVHCSSATVNVILQRLGEPIRDKSAAGFIRAARETPEFKARKAQSASAKLRGRRMRPEQLTARASTMAQNMSQRIGRYEAEISDALAEAGTSSKRPILWT